MTTKKSQLKKKSAAKKTNTVKKSSTKKSVPKSKMELAVTVMERMMPKYWEGETERKEILKELIKKAKLTKNGAATYFQKIKNKMVEDETN